MTDSTYLTSLMPGVLGQLQKQNRRKLYFDHPVMWAADLLGVKLWDRQAEIAQAVVDHHDVACKAGHEVGKSFLAGLLIAWWVDTRWELPGKVFVVSTAPSTKQINAVVWREVRGFYGVAQKRHDEYKRRIRDGLPLGEYELSDHALPGYITSDAHWKLPNGVELGYGSKPPDAKEDTMSGIHARYVLAVGDEAVGLTERLINDLQNITSNATSRRFVIMNPTNPLSYMGKVFKADTGTWKLETISVLDSPNFHGNAAFPSPTTMTLPCDEKCPQWEQHKELPPGLGFPVDVLETLVDHSYVDNKVRDYGKDHPEYITRVLGEFAWDAGPSLISPEELAIALDVELIEGDDKPVMGVDVSRSEKGDMNVAYLCQRGFIDTPEGMIEGEKIRYLDAWNDRNAMRTAKKINELALAHGVAVVYIDGTGLGGPIADRVRELSKGRYHCWDAIGSKAPPPEHQNRFHNARTWWYNDLRDKIAGGRMDIDHTDTQLTEELLGIQTRFANTGAQRMIIETKTDMRKRGVGSPDYADACMYSQIDPNHPHNNPYLMSAPGRFVIEDEYERPSQGARIGGYGVSV